MELAEAFDPIPPGAGPIGLLSSDEFLSEVDAFDGALLAASRGPRVALLLSAAGLAGAPQAGRNGLEHYRRLGADPFVIDVIEREQAVASALPDFDVLFMCGGSPRGLLRALLGSPLWDEALRRWRDGATLAGSSAGAMALCRHCLIPRPGDRMPTGWVEGLGPLTRCALAVHASSRPDQWLSSVAESAPCTVVALDDMTGVVLRAGEPPQLAGPGRARAL